MIVSIVTPVLNGGHYFRECLESVQAAFPAVEHIVLDGGSTDGSIELAQSFPVRLLRVPGTSLTARMNLGYRAAKGELIGFLGADDVLLGGAIEAVVAAHRSDGPRWLVGGLRWIDAEGQSLGNFGSPSSWLTPASFVSLDWSVIPLLSTYMHRDLFTELGGFDEKYSASADFELIARALRKEPFKRITRPLVSWRRHGENFSFLQKDVAAREASAIRLGMGLREGFGRSVRKLAMKLWFNLRNPDWCRRKMTERIRFRFGIARFSHYG